MPTEEAGANSGERFCYNFKRWGRAGVARQQPWRRPRERTESDFQPGRWPPTGGHFPDPSFAPKRRPPTVGGRPLGAKLGATFWPSFWGLLAQQHSEEQFELRRRRNQRACTAFRYGKRKVPRTTRGEHKNGNRARAESRENDSAQRYDHARMEVPEAKGSWVRNHETTARVRMRVQTKT